MTNKEMRVCGLGWVLPFGVGAGVEILERRDWIEAPAVDNEKLAGFSAKPYISSVKGYLDPAGACALAAASLALDAWKPDRDAEVAERFGVSSATHLGSTQSGYAFYQQFLQKGARFASPLLFPHSYPNTAGNLAAIEFGLGGPHMVFYGAPAIAHALAFADMRLADGTADDMLVVAYEAAVPATIPDHLTPLHGAIAIWLSTAPAVIALAGLRPASLPVEDNGKGSVHALLDTLTAPGNTIVK